MSFETAIMGALLLTILLLLVIIWRLQGRPANPMLDTERLLEELVSSSSRMSLEAVEQAQQSFLGLAEPRLQFLGVSITKQMERMTALFNQLERDRDQKFGELTGQLKAVGEQTRTLGDATRQLRDALANARTRGQWGERMAEDVLRLLGFQEGVNYQKQQTMVSNGSRPDFTFLLPQSLKLNMDVKFPLENYLRCVEAESAEERQRYCAAFLRDARSRLKEVVTRDYIDPQQNTLTCVLLFVPNEQVYQFIQEHDPDIIEDSLKKQVVLCSPMTLFAILVVIRQAVDNFTLQQTSNQVITEMGAFKQQWERFNGQLEAVERRIHATQREFQTLMTTRRYALERPLQRIEDLRRERGLSLPEDLVLTEEYPLDHLEDEKRNMENPSN